MTAAAANTNICAEKAGVKNAGSCAPILILTGPTAVGKSDLALVIAEQLRTPIISADSMQIYKSMNIGTAKPSIDEQARVKHLLIDIVEPNAAFSGYLYKEAAEEAIRGLNVGQVPFLVGGTAFYIESLLFPLDYRADANTQELRDRLWTFYEINGVDALFQMLEEKDEAASKAIEKNNVKRVIRALEIMLSSGVKLSERTRSREPRYNNLIFAVNLEREALYRRINQRVDKMLAGGLVDEVESIYAKYKNRSLQSLQAIGYKEIIAYLEGEISLEKAKEDIKQHSRNYAKRQLTFIKRLKPIWLDAQSGIEENSKSIILKYNEYSKNLIY